MNDLVSNSVSDVPRTIRDDPPSRWVKDPGSYLPSEVSERR